MKYEMHFGEIFSLKTERLEPDFIITISDEQRQLIETLANSELDGNLCKTYIINKLRFKIAPHFELTKEKIDNDKK